jgi:hypothetical protein
MKRYTIALVVVGAVTFFFAGPLQFLFHQNANAQSSGSGQLAATRPSQGEQAELDQAARAQLSALRQEVMDLVSRPNCEKHRIFFSANANPVISQDDAPNGATNIKYTHEDAKEAQVYIFTVPLASDFNNKYEVLVAMGEAPEAAPRYEVKVVAKREKDFDVQVIVFSGKFQQFQVECLVVRR